MEKWKNSTIRQIDNLKIIDWNDGRMEEWKNGRMEKWKNGKIR
jgi:hypothetical protein